jgi:hypothetical protein
MADRCSKNAAPRQFMLTTAAAEASKSDRYGGKADIGAAT